MKAIVCELCGSNDIVKQDGLFVCQHCGTKYSAEEAKKLLGAVKIDRSEEFEKYMELAETFKRNGDNKNEELYFAKALEINPDSYYAYEHYCFAHCINIFADKLSTKCNYEISAILSSSFGVCIDIMQRVHPELLNDNETIEQLIQDYDARVYYLHAYLWADHFNEIMGKLPSEYRHEVHAKIAPDLECLNSVYEAMDKKLCLLYHPGHPSINFCRSKWTNFLNEYGKYFIDLNPRKIQKQIAASDQNQKRGFFKLFR